MTSSSLLLSLIHLYLTYSMYPLYMFYNIKIHTYVYVKKIWKKGLIVLPQKNLKPKCIPNVLNTLTSLWHFWDSFLVFPLHPWSLCSHHCAFPTLKPWLTAAVLLEPKAEEEGKASKTKMWLSAPVVVVSKGCCCSWPLPSKTNDDRSKRGRSVLLLLLLLVRRRRGGGCCC